MALTGPHVECGPVILSYCRGYSSPEKLENPVPLVKKKNHTSLDDRIALEDESKILEGTRKCIFCQTSVNAKDQS